MTAPLLLVYCALFLGPRALAVDISSLHQRIRQTAYGRSMLELAMKRPSDVSGLLQIAETKLIASSHKVKTSRWHEEVSCSETHKKLLYRQKSFKTSLTATLAELEHYNASVREMETQLPAMESHALGIHKSHVDTIASVHSARKKRDTDRSNYETLESLITPALKLVTTYIAKGKDSPSSLAETLERVIVTEQTSIDSVARRRSVSSGRRRHKISIPSAGDLTAHIPNKNTLHLSAHQKAKEEIIAWVLRWSEKGGKGLLGSWTLAKNGLEARFMEARAEEKLSLLKAIKSEDNLMATVDIRAEKSKIVIADWLDHAFYLRITRPLIDALSTRKDRYSKALLKLRSQIDNNLSSCDSKRLSYQSEEAKIERQLETLREIRRLLPYLARDEKKIDAKESNEDNVEVSGN
ncbi:hypothetical protein AAMO2058_001750800, partial [Amorphochlora amoebiformis]